MKIIQSKQFKEQLKEIQAFICRYSLNASKSFLNDLYAQIQGLNNMPYKFRKSYSFDDENIRDFIFKGYVIPYLIDKKSDTIVILAIFKHNQPKLKKTNLSDFWIETLKRWIIY